MSPLTQPDRPARSMARRLGFGLAMFVLPLAAAPAQAAGPGSAKPVERPKPRRPDTGERASKPGANSDSGSGSGSGSGHALAKGATLTAWGKHGGRKWSVCNERVLEAERALPSFTDQAAHLGAEHPWAQRARACPHAVAVLELAARKEALHLVRLPDGINGDTPMQGTMTELTESRARALTWLAAAEREAQRRGDPTPRELDYWRARVQLSLGRVDAAAASLRRSDARGDVAEAKRQRLAALVALYDGDLERASDLARQAWLSAPLQDARGRGVPDRLLAAAIYALVLDRAGDDEGARRMMKLADISGDRSALALQRIESFMPMHERLYFYGLWISVVRQKDRKLAIRYFQAYLAQDAVAEPERKLAERHIERLRPKPGRLGG